MGQVLHGSATTSEAVRRAIQHSHAWMALADQGLCFAANAMFSSAVMSSASHEGSSVNGFLLMAIRGELSFPQGIPC